MQIKKEIVNPSHGIELQIEHAKKYPRETINFIENATQLAILDLETAESCFYYLPPKKGDNGKMKEIEGKSIRLAEICLYCWGNMYAASRILDNDGKFITVEGAAWDLEQNVTECFQIKRSIRKSNGEIYSQHMQTQTANAGASIVLRNAILKTIPTPLTNIVYKNIKKHVVKVTRTKNLVERFLKNWKIEENEILSFFNKTSISSLDKVDIERLMGIGTSIKNGYIEPKDAFTKVNLEIEEKNIDRKSLLEEIDQEIPIDYTSKNKIKISTMNNL